MDTQGNLLGALVNAASEKDGVSLLELVQRKRKVIPQLKRIYADSAYNRREIRDTLEAKYGIQLEIVLTPRTRMWVHRDHIEEALEYLRAQKGFRVQPRRWVVERSFAWISKHRRLSKDYEFLPEVTESYIYAAMALTNLKKNVQTNMKMSF